MCAELPENCRLEQVLESSARCGRNCQENITAAGKAKSARVTEQVEKDSGFFQSRIPDMFSEGSRESTNEAWARYTYETGRPSTMLLG